MARTASERPVVAPNMADYEAERASFRWSDAAAALDGLPAGAGLNIAHEAVDRHAGGPDGGGHALHCIDRAGERHVMRYAELAEASNRFANVLAALGVSPGERVFSLLPRGAALYVTAIGTLKHRAVLAPLFSAFGPEPLRQRVAIGTGVALVTTAQGYERRVAPVRSRLPTLRHVLVAGLGPSADSPPGTHNLDALLAAASGDHEIGPTAPQDPALLHFTSGTTGAPKGAVHVHGAVVAHHATGRIALDLHPGDVYWCTADPGWVTGTSYGIVAPLVHGVTVVVDEGELDAATWYGILESERVAVWYTAPTALRMLMRAGPEAVAGRDLSALRLVASVGEALEPAVVRWGREVLGRTVLDTWWQTETGGIMIANYRCLPVRPGSMGRPMPGVEAAVLRRDEQGDVVLDAAGAAVEAADGEEGELALRPGWPSMFRGYLGDEARTRACFAGGWYRSGDLVRRDPDGYYWFVGRGDDVIKSAGHLIGPFEVESVLVAHPAVAEAGVFGVPDPVAGAVVHAHVVLRAGVAATEELRRDILAWARRRLGAAVAPRAVEFDDALPHTVSGKIMRRLLRARALGLEEGDLSTLEGAR